MTFQDGFDEYNHCGHSPNRTRRRECHISRTDPFTSPLYVNGTLNVTKQKYAITFKDQQGTPLATISGDIADNQLSASWVPTTAGKIAASVSLFDSDMGQRIDLPDDVIFDPEPGYLGDQRFVIAYGVNDAGTVNFQQKFQKAMVDYVVNILGCPDGSEYDLLPILNSYECCAFNLLDNAASKRTLLSALQQGDNFFWVGHGAPYGICPVSLSSPDRGFLTTDQVAHALGNDNNPANPKRLYRLVFLRGCNTYSKPWAAAFGMTDFFDNNTLRPRSPAKSIQYLAVGRRPRAFIGYKVCCTIATDPHEIGGYMDSFGIFFEHWMSGETLEHCMQIFDRTLLYLDNKDYGISGCIDLTRLDSE